MYLLLLLLLLLLRVVLGIKQSFIHARQTPTDELPQYVI